MKSIFEQMNMIDDNESLHERYNVRNFSDIRRLQESRVSTRSLYEDDEQDEVADKEAETSNSSGEEVISKLQNANYEQFVKILNSDKKSKAFLQYLQSHYKMGDDALGTIKKATASEEVVTCSALKPTQQNISVKKSLGMITEGGWSINIIKDPVNAFRTPTVTYAGKYIIDGHHRWSKIVALHGPDAKLKVLNFPAISGVDWEDMLKAVELAIVTTNPEQELVTPVGNDNMLSKEGAQIAMNFYNQNACEEVVTAMKEIGRGDTKEKQARTIGKNVLGALSVSAPVAGAQKRDYMPQMDDSGRAKAQLLNQGVVDVTENLEEYWDEEAPYGRHGSYYGSNQSKGMNPDGAPQWWKNQGGTDASWKEAQRSKGWSSNYDLRP